MADELRAVDKAWRRHAKAHNMGDGSPERSEPHAAARHAFVRGWIAALKWERRRKGRHEPLR